MAVSTKLFFVVLAIAAIFLPSIIATDYIVGDNQGWTQGQDYQIWAEGKQFFVGDKLIFRYTKGSHNVLEVDGQFFQRCEAPGNVGPLATGNDEITLSEPGKKWYICSFPNHCSSGNMKLAITVSDQADGPSSPPPPPPGGNSAAPAGTTVSIYYAFIAVLVGFVVIMASY